MPSLPRITRETFLANLRESGLLRADQLAEVANHLPDSPRGRVLARALVEMGLLTRYQAEQLLAGRSQGFFLGQYRILEELGKGGMGRVFKAVHQTMNRVVALKVLKPYSGNIEQAQRLFFREMQAIARLSHPNIVTAFDAGEIAGRAYLVMEYVDGPNLETLVQQQGPLPIGQACELIRQAALGLQYAFEKGMIHRDIKPGNLLLARDGETSGRCTVKVLDFGLARLYEPHPFDLSDGDSILSREHVVLGTPDYVSPEQARNLHSADIRSDLYSLGCTLYFLLTGEVVFSGGTLMEKLIRHTAEIPAPVTRRRREVPPAVAAIVARLLAKKPADRFQTPAELVAALQPFAVELPVPIAIVPSDDGPLTPTHAPDSDFPWKTAAAGAQSTLAMHFAPTQLGSALPPQLRTRRSPRDDYGRRVFLALVIGVGVIGALIGMIHLLWGR